ncbi:MAG: hypothetical protein CYPHOPRED_002850, partial [Cyphobasidiales sp. Tagirdzhanova-0007]
DTSFAGPVFSNVTFSVSSGDVLVIQGPSGAGKSVLLKCLAHILVFPSGFIYLRGKEVDEYSVPAWRSRVLYLPQRPALLPDTPRIFFETVSKYDARKSYFNEKRGAGLHVGRGRRDPYQIADEWLVEKSRWDQTWNQLSGGEAQRIALAIGLAMEPEILLLDEPTSALDPKSTLLVERTLTRLGAEDTKRSPTLIWVTHSAEQAARIGSDTLKLPGRMQEV